MHIFHPKTKDFITENEVHTKFGVDISQFVDYQALVGDPGTSFYILSIDKEREIERERSRNLGRYP